MKTTLKRFVIVLTNHNKTEVYCTSTDFIIGLLGSSLTLKTCPNETRWPYHIKSKTFFLLNSHDRISISVTKYAEKQKHFSYSVFHARTRKLNVTFPILSLKVDHLGTFVIKPNFNILCYLGLLEFEMTN